MSTQPQPALPELEAAYQRVRDAVSQGRSFVLTTHRGPDGDGLGAESALAEALRQMGKRVSVLNSDPVTDRYRFLAGADSFETYTPARHRSTLAEADVAILLDAATAERTGRLARPLSRFKGTRIAIDHHQQRGWATLDLVDSRACAATELVHDLIGMLPVKLSPAMAEALYAGLVTDTQSFTTAHTTPGAHRRAASLMDAGADAVRVHQALYAAWDLERMRLLGGFLSGLRSAAAGQLVWGVVRQADFQNLGRRPDEAEGFVDQALTIAGSKVALLLREEPDGSYSVSFRSRPGVRVDRLARALGGGGHPLAAGATVTASQAGAMLQVLERSEGSVAEALASS